VKIKQAQNSVNTTHTRCLQESLYHKKGRGRKPYNPLALLETQLLKHLLRIPSDQRLALHLKHYRKAPRAICFE
jgi:hypothetical protein